VAHDAIRLGRTSSAGLVEVDCRGVAENEIDDGLDGLDDVGARGNAYG
jgi:hypothetical protein